MDRAEPANPLRRETLAQQVRDVLLEDVRTSQPGVTLPSESRLVQRFGVGRQVVREALQSLQAMGVVEIVNGRGAVVRPLSSEPLRSFFDRARGLTEDSAAGTIQILEVRRAIEMQTAYLAAERRSEEQLEAILSLLDQMQAALEDDSAYRELDARFHHAISDASGNGMLALLHESTREPAPDPAPHELAAPASPDRQARIHDLHGKIAEYIRAQDATAARDAMARHFDEAIAAVQSAQVEAPSISRSAATPPR